MPASLGDAFPGHAKATPKRLTVNLPEELHKKRKLTALKRDTSITQLLIEYIETLDY